MKEPAIRGSFERAVLLTLARLGDDAYGVPIRAELAQRLGRAVSVGAVYTTLDRLIEKGLVSSHTGEPTAVRGGRAKRYFRLEAAGRAALEQARREVEAMWAPGVVEFAS